MLLLYFIKSQTDAGLGLADLKAMLPTKGEGMKIEPIRICGACCEESFYHRLKWQSKSVWKCDRHQLKLLSKCPKCGARFKIPSLWKFDRCCLSFSAMANYQKPANG